MRTLALAFTLLVTAVSALAAPARPAADTDFDAFGPFSWCRMASDGADFLVIGSDSFIDGVLYTQRVIDGRPAGPRRQIGEGYPAGLAWTGSDFLAAWRHQQDLWVAPVSREGTLRSMPEGPVVKIEQYGSAMFAAGRHSAMAFGYSESSFIAQPLDLTGKPSRAPVTHTAPAIRANVSVAETADGLFVAVFTDWTGTSMMLFRPDGTSVTPSPVLLDGPYGGSTSTYSSGVSQIATDGTDTLIMYGAGQHDAVGELKTVLLGANGAVKSKHIVKSQSGGDRRTFLPTGLVWDGTQYVASLNYHSVNDRRPALLRISRDGASAGELSWLTKEGDSSYAWSVATNGRRLLALAGSAVMPVDSATLRPHPPRPLGQTLSSQDAVTIEAGFGGYLAVWYHNSAGETTIRASRIDANGNYLDGGGIVLDHVQPFSRHDPPPFVAIDATGPQWFVVWRRGWGMRGRSISRAGVPARNAVNIGDGTEADLLWDGSRYIVLRAGESLYKDVMTANGTIVETTLLAESEERIEDGGMGMGSLTYHNPNLVAPGGKPVALFTSNLNMCWIGTPGGCGEEIDVLSMRLDTPGATPLTIAKNTWGELQATSAGAQAAAIWSSYTGMFASFISADGQATSPILVAKEARSGSVAHDGTGFVAAWRNASTSHNAIATARLTTSGVTSEQTAIRRDRALWFVGDVSLAARPGLRPLVAFMDRDPAFDSIRRVALLFENEFAMPDEVPPAPIALCATKHTDDTITAPVILSHSPSISRTPVPRSPATCAYASRSQATSRE